MNTTDAARAVFDRGFLELRHQLLGVAATLDRVDRSSGSDDLRNDPRMEQIREAVRLLVDGEGDRAKRLQMVFSRPYDSDWQDG